MALQLFRRHTRESCSIQTSSMKGGRRLALEGDRWETKNPKEENRKEGRVGRGRNSHRNKPYLNHKRRPLKEREGTTGPSSEKEKKKKDWSAWQV